jgi:site-specific DNA-methyltransferase (adenine-specific)
MTPRNVVIVGDAVKRLRRLAPTSVDCVVTSPPYFGLRDYGADGQIGLEGSVTKWVDRLVEVADEIARVLKPSGCFWLNVGDSYARSARHGAAPKSLLLGPERLLLALSHRGWIVRNRLAWVKANPMPSSVRDRLTCSWEHLYLLTRSPTYFFDLDAARLPHRSRRQPAPGTAISREKATWAGPLAGSQSGLARLKRSGRVGHPLGRNPGDAWILTTSSFRGGHHATFPEALVERPLRLTCPERVCAECGEPWRRDTPRTIGQLAVLGDIKPACDHKTRWVPGLVLDPFMGSGTTAVVAERLGRDWLGIELSPTFAALAEDRLARAREARAA